MGMFLFSSNSKAVREKGDIYEDGLKFLAFDLSEMMKITIRSETKKDYRSNPFTKYNE